MDKFLIWIIVVLFANIVVVLIKGHQRTKPGIALRNANKRIVVKNHRQKIRDERKKD